MDTGDLGDSKYSANSEFRVQGLGFPLTCPIITALSHPLNKPLYGV